MKPCKERRKEASKEGRKDKWSNIAEEKMKGKEEEGRQGLKRLKRERG